jgi:hypothetical protein
MTRRDIIQAMEDLVPFQVQLERRQHAQLKRLAAVRGQSMGSMIRESVAAYLSDREAEEEPLLGIIGMFEDTGPTPYGDVSTNHDAYLADIHWREGHPEAADE